MTESLTFGIYMGICNFCNSRKLLVSSVQSLKKKKQKKSEAKCKGNGGTQGADKRCYLLLDVILRSCPASKIKKKGAIAFSNFHYLIKVEHTFRERYFLGTIG